MRLLGEPASMRQHCPRELEGGGPAVGPVLLPSIGALVLPRNRFISARPMGFRPGSLVPSGKGRDEECLIMGLDLSRVHDIIHHPFFRVPSRGTRLFVECDSLHDTEFLLQKSNAILRWCGHQCYVGAFQGRETDGKSLRTVPLALGGVMQKG